MPHRPQALAGAILLRAMVPLAKPPRADLAGKPVLIVSGAQDPIAAPDNAARLAEVLRQAGAAVEHEVLPGGHPLSNAERSESFDIGPASVDGGSHTLRNTGGELPPHNAASGAEYRIVVDFAEPDRFLAVQNIGNCGIPGHKHYRDQFVPWLRGEYHTVHLDRRNIPVESTTVLMPN